MNKNFQNKSCGSWKDLFSRKKWCCHLPQLTRFCTFIESLTVPLSITWRGVIFISCSNSTTSAAGSGGRLVDNFPKQPRTELKIPAKAAAILGPHKAGENWSKMGEKKKWCQIMSNQLSTLAKGDDFQIWSQSDRPSSSWGSRLPFPMASRISLISHHQGRPSPGPPLVLWCYSGYPTGCAWAWQSGKVAGKCEWSLVLEISKSSAEWMVFWVFPVTPINQVRDWWDFGKLLPPSPNHQSPRSESSGQGTGIWIQSRLQLHHVSLKMYTNCMRNSKEWVLSCVNMCWCVWIVSVDLEEGI